VLKHLEVLLVLAFTLLANPINETYYISIVKTHSHLLLTGEFSQTLQPRSIRLLSGKLPLKQGQRPTTPAHRSVFVDGILPQKFVLCNPCINGDEGARTPDLNSAIVALFQLSYIPKWT
jgi:hypothetical protein